VGAELSPAGTVWEDHETGSGGATDGIGADGVGDGEKPETDAGLPTHATVSGDEEGERIGEEYCGYGEETGEGDLLHVEEK